jgi:hypothetical protein
MQLSYRRNLNTNGKNSKYSSKKTFQDKIRVKSSHRLKTLKIYNKAVEKLPALYECSSNRPILARYTIV